MEKMTVRGFGDTSTENEMLVLSNIVTNSVASQVAPQMEDIAPGSPLIREFDLFLKLPKDSTDPAETMRYLCVHIEVAKTEAGHLNWRAEEITEYNDLNEYNMTKHLTLIKHDSVMSPVRN